MYDLVGSLNFWDLEQGFEDDFELVNGSLWCYRSIITCCLERTYHKLGDLKQMA